ncbi:MAG: CPBP family intramembrane metalloprotease [Phycisphaerales bacterium]|nr:CPBP family intramembrane metalloprotease [Phycisphaerales bacterium]
MGGSKVRHAESEPVASGGGYFAHAQKPLHILVFLLPLLVAYELGAILYLSGEGGQPNTIAAWGMLARFFEMFGAFGFHLPAALLVTVLLVWHLLQRDPWTVRLPVLVGMAMEACVWTVPLTILLILLQSVLGGGDPTPAQVQTAAPEALRELPWQAKLTISAGAGLYEELLFRMIAIAAIHAVLVDIMRLSGWAGGVIAVTVSAGAFAVYHSQSGGPAMGLSSLVPYFVAGLYFGGLYLARGFGLVVAVHFLYDVVALMVSGQNSPNNPGVALGLLFG